MKVLPQAIAIGNIHSGTIAGKLNGVMPAHTPTGWRTRVRVHRGADVLRVLALQQLRDAAGELDHLDAALHRAHRVGQRLAVLLGDEPRDCFLVLLAAEPGISASRARGAASAFAPFRERGGGGLHRGIDDSDRAIGHALRDLAGGRVVDLAHAPLGRARTTPVWISRR